MTSPKLKHRLGQLQSAYQFYNIYDSNSVEKAKAASGEKAELSPEEIACVWEQRNLILGLYTHFHLHLARMRNDMLPREFRAEESRLQAISQSLRELWIISS
jgi:hypothetical protein